MAGFGPHSADLFHSLPDLFAHLYFAFDELQTVQKPSRQSWLHQVVKNSTAIAAFCYNAMCPQSGQMLRHTGVANSQGSLKGIDIPFTAAEFGDDAHAIGMGKYPKDTGQLFCNKCAARHLFQLYTGFQVDASAYSKVL